MLKVQTDKVQKVISTAEVASAHFHAHMLMNASVEDNYANIIASIGGKSFFFPYV